MFHFNFECTVRRIRVHTANAFTRRITRDGKGDTGTLKAIVANAAKEKESEPVEVARRAQKPNAIRNKEDHFQHRHKS